ncbi:hypothetical protein pb186bvf_016513 [Paramecium bursaria]
MKLNNRILILHIGNLVQGLSLFGFASLPYLDEDLFIPFSLIFRSIQGFGSAMYLTPFYALINSFWPDTIEQKMSQAEFFTSFGWFIGPVFGSLLYQIGGFPIPFIASGVITLLIASVLIKILDHDMEPNKISDESSERGQSLQIDHTNTDPLVINDTITSVIHDEDEPEKEIGYFHLLKHYEISAGFLTYFTLSCVFTFYNPTYAVFVENKYDKTPNTIGYYQSMGALTYSIASIFLVARIKQHKQYYIFIGSMICGVAQFFYGPERLLGLEDHLWITLLAQMTVGVASAYPFVLSLPFINEDLGYLYPDQKEKAINLSSGLFNWSLAFGELVSPVASGFLTDTFGFERASSIFGLWVLLSTLLYLPVFFIVKNHTKIQPKLDLVL